MTRRSCHTKKSGKNNNMSILLVAGSPSERSRSAALLDSVSQRLAGRGATIERLLIRDLSPQALLLADTAHLALE